MDGTVARSRSYQPNRAAILKQNRELRKSPDAVRTTSFGKLELDIPITDWKVLGKFFPGLDDPSHPDHKWQMRRFLKSPASDPYRIVERKKGVNKRG
jgi:hypothetical protein